MRRELLWLWLTNLKGIGKKKTEVLLNYYGDIEGIWESSLDELKEIKSLTQKDCELIIDSRNLDKISAYEEKILSKGITYTTFEQDNYPECLKNIFEPPYIIYIKGELPETLMNIGIVGARKCSEYGRTVAYNIAKSLAKENITIISGMARGIDTAAHKGAIEAGGKTIAVLGCGVDICYPKENIHLMKNIEKQGAVISEFPIGTIPKPGHFPLRNRIISGLSDALVVVEAAKRSGSLITADLALEQGKDVYAVPGNIYSSLSMGSNELIKQGARILTSSEDILIDYNIKSSNQDNDIDKNFQHILEKEEKMIYDSLGLEPLHTDIICHKLGMSTSKVQHLLTILELKGIIKQLSGNRYIKNM